MFKRKNYLNIFIIKQICVSGEELIEIAFSHI